MEAISPPIFSGLCAQKFQVVQIPPPLSQKPLHNKIECVFFIHLRLFYVDQVFCKLLILLITRFNKINKHEITMIIVSFLCYKIYNANKYKYNVQKI
jgi:hypothetical protein